MPPPSTSRKRSNLSGSPNQTAARDAPDKAFRHRDRGLAARSLHHLCAATSRSSRSIPSTCRCRRPIAARHPRSDRRVHANICQRLPAIVAHLRNIGDKHFKPLMERPEARALWWPRFLRIARWFADWETARRGDIASISPRPRATRDHARQRPEFTCRRAPTASNAAATAATPSSTTKPARRRRPSRSGWACPRSSRWRRQFCARAALPVSGANSSVGELAYVRLSGNNPPGEHKALELKIRQNDTPQPPDDAADYARAQLEELVRRFENPDEPYRSLVLSMWTARYGDYDNLARVKEWSAAGGIALEEW